MRLFFFLFAALILPLNVHSKQLRLKVRAESALLINCDNGVILFEKNAYEPMYPASITKIATALYALHTESDSLDRVLEAKKEALYTVKEAYKKKNHYETPAYYLVSDGMHVGIKPGEEFSLIDLLSLMMVCSGNDAANVIAQELGGTIPSYMEGLNHYLKESLGLQNTHFVNPHGLHHPEHKTCAFDMAMITKEALRFDVFREIVKKTFVERPKTNLQDKVVYPQFNKLLKKGPLYYKPAIGVKTGSTEKAKNTFVAAATSEGRTLIAVLLGVQERDHMFEDAKLLFEAAFQQKRVTETYLKKGRQEYTLSLRGCKNVVETVLKNDLSISFFPAEEQPLRCFLIWNSLKPPIHKGQKVGKIILEKEDGTIVSEQDLFAGNESKETLLYKLFGL